MKSYHILKLLDGACSMRWAFLDLLEREKLLDGSSPSWTYIGWIQSSFFLFFFSPLFLYVIAINNTNQDDFILGWLGLRYNFSYKWVCRTRWIPSQITCHLLKTLKASKMRHACMQITVHEPKFSLANCPQRLTNSKEIRTDSYGLFGSVRNHNFLEEIGLY